MVNDAAVKTNVLGEHDRRDVRFELLRIFAMFLIVLCHLVAHSGWRLEELPGWRGVVFLAVDNYAGQVGVGLFLLISGYFLVNKDFSWWRVIRTMTQTWCYSALLMLFMYVVTTFTPYFNWLSGVFGPQSIAHTLVLLLLPTLNGEYWFITVYVLLLVVSPFLNMVLRQASRKQLVALIAFLTFLSVMPYISFHPEGPHDAFYWTPFTYGLTLYVVGGWLRLYGATALAQRLRCWHLAVYTVVSFAVLTGLLWLWKDESAISRFFVWDPRRIYGAFPVLPVLLSVGIMAVVGGHPRSLMIGEKTRSVIQTAASSMFGVYLIHQHGLLSSVVWYLTDKALVTGLPVALLLCVFLMTLVVLFAVLTAAAFVFDRLAVHPVQSLLRKAISRR